MGSLADLSALPLEGVLYQQQSFLKMCNVSYLEMPLAFRHHKVVMLLPVYECFHSCQVFFFLYPQTKQCSTALLGASFAIAVATPVVSLAANL